MLRMHPVIYGIIILMLMILISWFLTQGFSDIVLSLLSSILTIGLVAAIVYLVQKKSKYNQD